MSDALLTEISKKLDVLATLFKAGAAPAATAPKADKPAAATATKAADKPAATATKPAATATKPAATKAPGGKHTVEQVREMIRKVAADVDKQSAKDILMDDGGGVEKVGDLKPENYDAVFEACEILLKGEGKGAAAAADDDLM